MVKIIVDSASDISQEEASKMQIEVVPIEVRFGDEEYLDGINLSNVEFYKKLAKCSELPKTSQINPYRWEEIFEKNLTEFDEIVVITISSKLSGTYSSATEAAVKFNGKVCVVDSLNACAGEKLLCEYAIKLRDDNKSAREIVDILNIVKQNIVVVAMLDTLKYLKMGGRISPLVAFAGEIMSIKPIIGVVDGEVKLIGKAMGSKKATIMIRNIVKEKGGIDFDMPFKVISNSLENSVTEKFIVDNAEILKEKAKDNITNIGCTIGTHVGTGALGFAFFEK